MRAGADGRGFTWPSPGEDTWDGSWHGLDGFLELGELFGGEKGKSWSEREFLGSSLPGILLEWQLQPQHPLFSCSMGSAVASRWDNPT